MKLTLLNRFSPRFVPFFLSGLAIVVFSTMVLFLSYQVRPTYSIQMGNAFDRHYLLDGFYAIESNPDLTYRWTGGFSKVEIKGVGKQPFKLRIEMLQSTLDPNQGKTVKVEVRGALLALFKVTNSLNAYEVFIPADLISRFSGDLTVIISTDTFRPQGERRDLGVVMTALTVEPASPAGLIIPPVQHLLYLIGIGLLVYGLALLLRLSQVWRSGLSLGAVTLAAICYAFLRQGFSFYSGSLLIALTMAGLTTLVAQPLVKWFFRRGGLRDFQIDRGEGRWLFVLFAIGLVIIWAGLLYPESDPNDFGFHLNRFRMVQNGDLYFDYIISGVGHSFYPPAMYVLLLPFGLLFQDAYFLIKLGPVLFDLGLIFVIYFVTKRYFGAYKPAALLASALYLVIPINLLVVWWAHQTNLFGLGCMLVTLVYLLELYERLPRWPVWLGLVLLFFLTLLSHPAILVFSGVYFPALTLVFLVLQRISKTGRLKPVLAMGSAFVVAAGLALVLYYSYYFPILGRSETNAQTNELAGSLSSLNNLGGILNLARLTFNIGFLGDYGLGPVLLVPFGLIIMFKKRAAPGDNTKAPSLGYVIRLRWAILSWLVVGLGGLLITIITNLSLRPMLFLWPVITILSGLALAAFTNAASKSKGTIEWRRVGVGLLLLGLGAVSLYFWFTANYLGQQPPHVF